MLLTRQILSINASRQWCGAIVVEIEVKTSITGPKALVFQEKWIIEEGERIKDVELCL